MNEVVLFRVQKISTMGVKLFSTRFPLLIHLLREYACKGSCEGFVNGILSWPFSKLCCSPLDFSVGSAKKV